MKQCTTTLDRHGRVVIPAEYRRALGLREGDRLTVEIADGTLRILTLREAIRRAQRKVTARTKGRRSLVEELAAERRAEATRD